MQSIYFWHLFVMEALHKIKNLAHVLSRRNASIMVFATFLILWNIFTHLPILLVNAIITFFINFQVTNLSIVIVIFIKVVGFTRRWIFSSEIFKRICRTYVLLRYNHFCIILSYIFGWSFRLFFYYLQNWGWYGILFL